MSESQTTEESVTDQERRQAMEDFIHRSRETVTPESLEAIETDLGPNSYKLATIDIDEFLSLPLDEQEALIRAAQNEAIEFVKEAVKNLDRSVKASASDGHQQEQGYDATELTADQRRDPTWNDDPTMTRTIDEMRGRVTDDPTQYEKGSDEWNDSMTVLGSNMIDKIKLLAQASPNELSNWMSEGYEAVRTWVLDDPNFRLRD